MVRQMDGGGGSRCTIPGDAVNLNFVFPEVLLPYGPDLAPSLSSRGTVTSHRSRHPTADNSDIFVMNADGSGRVNVDDNPAYDFDPTWSPDGTQIAFTRGRLTSPFDFDIFVMDADGGNQRSLTKRSLAHSRSASSGCGSVKSSSRPKLRAPTVVLLRDSDWRGGPSACYVRFIVSAAGGSSISGWTRSPLPQRSNPEIDPWWTRWEWIRGRLAATVSVTGWGPSRRGWGRVGSPARLPPPDEREESAGSAEQ